MDEQPKARVQAGIEAGLDETVEPAPITETTTEPADHADSAGPRRFDALDHQQDIDAFLGGVGEGFHRPRPGSGKSPESVHATTAPGAPAVRFGPGEGAGPGPSLALPVLTSPVEDRPARRSRRATRRIAPAVERVLLGTALLLAAAAAWTAVSLADQVAELEGAIAGLTAAARPATDPVAELAAVRDELSSLDQAIDRIALDDPRPLATKEGLPRAVPVWPGQLALFERLARERVQTVLDATLQNADEPPVLPDTPTPAAQAVAVTTEAKPEPVSEPVAEGVPAPVSEPTPAPEPVLAAAMASDARPVESAARSPTIASTGVLPARVEELTGYFPGPEGAEGASGLMSIDAYVAPDEAPDGLALRAGSGNELLVRVEDLTRYFPGRIESAEPAGTGARAGAGPWVVNLRSVTTANEALREVQRLHKIGIRAEVRPAVVNGRKWYRVRVSGFASARDAMEFGDRVALRTGWKGAWAARH